MGKTLFFAIAVLLSYTGWTQISFTERPSDLRLYPRNTATNKAFVVFTGTVTGAGYTAIRVLSFRGAVPLPTPPEQPAIQNANFNFSIEITAETVQYSFQVQLLSGSNWSTVHTYQNVVAGDAIIIQGQSNALAALSTSDAPLPASYNNATPNSFIRVFGSASPTLTNADVTNMQWFPADGNGSSTDNGNCGQWGYVLSRNIVQTKAIPIAVFNGAHGGPGIDFFKKAASSGDLNSNYGRLYARVNKAGFNSAIRAIFWFQGEGDAYPWGNPRETFSSYKSKLQTLYNNWKSDYATPGQRYYFHQIRTGCNGELERTQFVNEAIRQVAEEDIADSRLYNSGALQQETADQGDPMNQFCHYRFTNGYEKLGNDWAAVIFHDLYGDGLQPNVLSPRVTEIERTAGNQLTLTMATADPLTITAGSLANFRFDGAAVRPNITATSSGNQLVLTLDAYPENLTGLSYNENHKGQNSPDIVNGAFLSLINFSNYPILLGTFPVKIVSFSGKVNEDQSISLKWTVANEQNVSRYEIQAGVTSSDFATVGVREATNRSNRHDYSFVHLPYGGNSHYYRLKIMDYDNKVTYSSVLPFKQVSGTKFTVKAIGRDHSSEINLLINSPVASKIEFDLFTAVGELIVHNTSSIVKGVNQLNINAGKSLSKGVYLLQVRSEISTETVRFLIR